MAQVSSILFVLGVIAVAIGFAAHVGHAVLLANGRRVIALAPVARPAFATGGVTGSFVTSRTASSSAPLGLAASPTPLSNGAIWFTLGAFVLLVASLVLRAVVVGRGPYGNLYEFSAAFATSILGGYLFLQRRYPIRQIGMVADGRGAGAAAVRVVAAVGDRAARPGAPERAAADDPRRDGGPGVRDLRHGVRGGHRVPRPGDARPVRVAAVAQDARRGRLPRGHHRLPDLRDDDRARVVVGLDRLVALLGLGPQGDRGAGHVAGLRRVPPRAQPAAVGRAARRRCCSSSGS